jgi:hypothetical protein
MEMTKGIVLTHLHRRVRALEHEIQNPDHEEMAAEGLSYEERSQRLKEHESKVASHTVEIAAFNKAIEIVESSDLK